MAGFLRTTAALGLISFVRTGVCLRRVTVRAALFARLGFAAALWTAFLAIALAGFDRNFVTFVLLALFARALPAGERFVAGFKRVDFAAVRFTDSDFAAGRRVTERDDDFFADFATGLLMGKNCETNHSIEHTLGQNDERE